MNEKAVLDALPFANPGVTSLSFEWTKNSKMVGDKSVLTVDKVTRDHCDGFYTCEVSKNKQLCFKVHHCLRCISKLLMLKYVFICQIVCSLPTVAYSLP